MLVVVLLLLLLVGGPSADGSVVGALHPLTGLFSAAALRKFSRQILIVPLSKFVYRIKKC